MGNYLQTAIEKRLCFIKLAEPPVLAQAGAVRF
jgi:hypothetical protein